jgi:hypothetical protein
MALLGFQVVLITAEKDVMIVEKKAEEIDAKVEACKEEQELLVLIEYLFGTVQYHKDSCL